MNIDLKKISDILKRHRTVAANFGYLSILQAYTIVIPLITIPFLMRFLGKENYGLVVTAQAIIQYFVIVVNFGFNISATKHISIHRDNPQKVSEIVSSVMSIKVVLFFVALIALSVVVCFVPLMREHYVLFFLCMLLCMSEVLFPVWFFQGIEKMRYITIVNVISRTLFAACLFIFIRKPEHYIFVPMFNGTGAVIGGVVALWIVFKKEKVHFSFQKLSTLWYYLKDSAPLFLTRASAQIYVRTNIVVVASVLGLAEAAYYDTAHKVVTVLAMPFQTLKTAIFPKVTKDLNIKFVYKTIKVVVLAAIVAIIGVQLFSGLVIRVIFGEYIAEADTILRLLSVILLAMVLSGFFGEQLLIPFGKKRSYVKGMVSTAIFYFVVLSVLYLLNLLNLYSIVLIVVGTEFFLSAYFMLAAKKNKLV